MPCSASVLSYSSIFAEVNRMRIPFTGLAGSRPRRQRELGIIFSADISRFLHLGALFSNQSWRVVR
jgi:hypothetical protein